MSIIGLDFGSHSLSIALYYEDKDVIEVIADDIGSRHIPCCVAFRGTEILTGQSAVSQQHKNVTNTFADIRARLLDSNQGQGTVKVPALDKDISTLDIGSHFFRNVHNQVKQQVGHVVRNCVISLPESFDNEAKQRVIKSAQEGGLRVKSVIYDPIAVMLAYQMDDKSILSAKVVVVDMGYSKTEVAIYDVRCGVFFNLAGKFCTTACGKDMVRLVSEHCAKDFNRRAKIPCIDNARAMMRLRRECETAIKSLSTGAEAQLDIDSLCEGVDYSSKLSRARFEDLCTLTFMALKTVVLETLASASGLQASDVTHVCLAGGMTSVPKVQATLHAIFPSAHMPSNRSRLDPSEVNATGAAQHARVLIRNKLVDGPMPASESLSSFSRSLFLIPSAASASQPQPFLLIPSGAILPVDSVSKLLVEVPSDCTRAVLIAAVGPETEAATADMTPIGQIGMSVTTPEGMKADDSSQQIDLEVHVTVTLLGEINISVNNRNKNTLVVTGSLTIPPIS